MAGFVFRSGRLHRQIQHCFDRQENHEDNPRVNFLHRVSIVDAVACRNAGSRKRRHSQAGKLGARAFAGRSR
jgi:hypothetical protein